MPGHHNLEVYLDAYMHAAGLFGAKGTPLFRSADWHGGAMTQLPMQRIDVWRMVQRRAADLGTRVRIGCHTFRATGITAYLIRARWAGRGPLLRLPHRNPAQ